MKTRLKLTWQQRTCEKLTFWTSIARRYNQKLKENILPRLREYFTQYTPVVLLLKNFG